jgi:hypothetical protein
MKYDETELIEFFGILPSEQDLEEKEFFGTTIFDYRQNNYHLSISFSIYRNDFYLDLKDSALEEPILQLRFERVEEIRVRRDKPTSVPALTVKVRCDAEEDEKAGLMQAIQIGLEPNICISFTNRFE